MVATFGAAFKSPRFDRAGVVARPRTSMHTSRLIDRECALIRRVLAASTSALMLAALPLTGLAHAERGPQSDVVASLFGDYRVSEAALATAVRNAAGDPVGIQAYETPIRAIEAGDMAAFIALVRLSGESGDMPPGLGNLVLAVDRIAAEDYDEARSYLADGRGEDLDDSILNLAAAWILALEDDQEGAIEAQRDAAPQLPGLTGDLSLAAMLEALGREEEALAVYAALTPRRIEAPEHEFDPQGLLFTHIRMVVSRRALLLRRLGRVEEAKTVYQALADAEPERAVFYDAALDSLETGRGLEDQPLTLNGAFARSMSDLSLALYQQRIISNAMMGRRLRGLDEQRATFDQLALLLDPENEGLREIVIGTLAEEALYEGAAHTALTAPDPSAPLQIAAAQTLMNAGQLDKSREAIAFAIDLAEPDDKLATLSGAIGLHALMGDEARALKLADTAIDLVENPAEEAAFNALKANILQQFGRYSEAVTFASRARDLDDTHDRRMALASLMGEAGMIDEAVRLLQLERLKRPDDPYMLNTYGYFLLEHTDRYSEAYKVLYLANSLAPNNPYIADSLGWAYYKLGHLDRAKRLIELARRELAPLQHWEIEDHLGDILWHEGDREGARAAWEIALGEFPPDDLKTAIEAKLERGIEGGPPERQTLPAVNTDPEDVERRKT